MFKPPLLLNTIAQFFLVAYRNTSERWDWIVDVKKMYAWVFGHRRGEKNYGYYNHWSSFQGPVE